MYKRIVLFGELDAAHYAENGIEALEENKNELSGQIVEHEFQTLAECDAYIKGVNDTLGWNGAVSIGDDDFDRIKALYNSPTNKAW